MHLILIIKIALRCENCPVHMSPVTVFETFLSEDTVQNIILLCHMTVELFCSQTFQRVGPQSCGNTITFLMNCSDFFCNDVKVNIFHFCF